MYTQCMYDHIKVILIRETTLLALGSSERLVQVMEALVLVTEASVHVLEALLHVIGSRVQAMRLQA